MVSKTVSIAVVILVIVAVAGGGYWYYTTLTRPEKIRLHFIWTFDEYEEWGQNIADKYMEDHPNVVIEVTIMEQWEVEDAIDAWIAAGTMPDICQTNTNKAPTLYEKGAIEPLNDYWETYEDKDKYMPAAVELAKYDGKLLLLPQLAGGTGICFRKDLVEAAGYTVDEITTWDKWIEVLEATQNPDENLYGVAFCAGDPFMFSATFIQAALSNGVDMMDIPTDFEQSREELIETIELFVNMSKLGLLAPDSYAYEFADTATAWGTGVAVSTMTGKFMKGMLGEVTQLITPETIDAVAFPGGPHGAPVWQAIISGFYITPQCKNKDVAWDFIKFANNKENNADVTAHIHDTARLDVTAEYRAQMFPDVVEGWWFNIWYNAMAPNLWPKPMDPRYAANHPIITEEVVKAMMGQQTPEEAFESMKTRLYEAIS